MSSLLVWKERIQQFYANQSIYVDKTIQFLLGLLSFYLINQNIGLMKAAATPIVTVALAIICVFLPPVFTAFAAAALVLAHTFTLSIGVMGITALIFVMMFIFYCRFTPSRAIILLITPLAFLMKVPYVIPIACGLVLSPVLAIPIAFGTIVYYMILCIKNSATAITGADGIMGQISLYVKLIFQNKQLWIYVVAFTICIFTVYVIRRLAVDHAWEVAIGAGALVNIIAIVFGDLAFNIHTSYGSMILGNIAAVIIGVILEFFVFSVDYSRTEHMQYEDDEYYYYVKAVPKLSVAAPEKTVKRINERKNSEESELAEEEEIMRKPNRKADSVHNGNRHPAGNTRRQGAGERRPSGEDRRAGGERKQSGGQPRRQTRVPSNTDELLLAKSLQEELDIQNIVDRELKH